jgi:hypothetical protein
MADTPKIWIVRLSAAISRGIAIVRELVWWPVADGPARWELPTAVEPRRLTLQDQWNYLTEIVMGAASRAEEASRCQASATLQLDLAQYALTSLVDELSAVMDMGGRRRRATVHVLGIAPQPRARPIGDAIAA